jgi:uncharacterized protein (DUF885 family)
MDFSSEFEGIMNEYWEYKKRENPTTATFSGDHRYNNQLGDNSETAIIKNKEIYQQFLDKLEKINPDELNTANNLNYMILIQKLTLEMERINFKAYRMPISTFGSFYTFFPILGQIAPLRNVEDFENLLNRYKSIPKHIDNYIIRMRTGLKEGQIPPKVSLKGVEQAITEQVETDLDESPYLLPFKVFPETITKEQRDKINGKAIEIVTNEVFPSLMEFRDFVIDEYIPKCRDSPGISDLSFGKDFYQHCIKYYTSLDYTPEEIHKIGLKEVTRIREEMAEIMQQVNFKGSFQEFFEFMRFDQQFYPKSKEELLEKTAFVLKKIDGKLPEIFKTLPRLPYGIREIPEYEAPHTTTAYYRPGSGDGTRAGTYFINTYDLKSRPLYEIEALSLHEAVPGHHLQIALQQETNIPEFRKYSNYTSYVEGWALYAERLGLELGFYEDPYSNFGRLSYEIWRACRLVVDTGIHALDWSRQQAIDFMAANSSLTILNITNEVDRYISWPGQALAYKLGELKIRELRESVEQALGGKFDLREFHDLILLDGSLPLDILDNKVKSFIQTYVKD